MFHKYLLMFHYLTPQVVMFIKASRETHSGELALVVRPNVYVSEDQSDEPDLTYIPETHQIASSGEANTLESSLMLLQVSFFLLFFVFPHDIFNKLLIYPFIWFHLKGKKNVCYWFLM